MYCNMSSKRMNCLKIMKNGKLQFHKTHIREKKKREEAKSIAAID